MIKLSHSLFSLRKIVLDVDMRMIFEQQSSLSESLREVECRLSRVFIGISGRSRSVVRGTIGEIVGRLDQSELHHQLASTKTRRR